MTPIKRVFAIIALGGVAVASWFVGSGLVQNVQYARAREQVETARADLEHARELSNIFRTVGKAVEPSVVLIQATKKVQRASADDLRRSMPFDDDILRRFFGDRDGDGNPDIPENFGGGDGDNSFDSMSQGSGVIIETDGSTGYIVTNNHVAGGASSITVTLADGREFKNAKLVGADPKTDLAVIKIEADRLIPARWGNSDEMQKGDFVLAFGAPFGFVGSMTHGIVSGLNRSTEVTGQRLLGPYGYEQFIQVDCPINPGNSGGPLVNLKGDVVGINTAILTRSGGFQGVGFAIPSNQAQEIYGTLKSEGRVTRGFLGVEIFDAGKARERAKQMGIEGEGVVVNKVTEGQPADGVLEPADVIQKINGKDVKSVDELRKVVAGIKPGTEATFSILRDGKPQEVKIKIGEQPDTLATAASPRRGGEGQTRTTGEKLGLRLTDPTAEQLQRFGLERGNGALVTGVEPGSPAANAGLRPGDLITRVGARNINSADDALEALSQADVSKGIGLHVSSRDGKRFVFMQSTKN